MRSFHIAAGIVCGLGFGSALHAGQAPVFRNAATHEQLVAQRRMADLHDPMKKMPAAKGADPSLSNQPMDLLSQSDIIAFQGTATLVPKRAIISIPKNHAGRLGMVDGARIVSWADFYAANRGWITTVEVSRIQAEGNMDIAPETKEHISKSGNLIVATYMGGPISVLPLKVPVTSKP